MHVSIRIMLNIEELGFFEMGNPVIYLKFLTSIENTEKLKFASENLLNFLSDLSETDPMKFRTILKELN